MLKIGDKVRFLNSVGGGIIKSFEGKDRILVEDESGFDFPVLISECVLVGEGVSEKTNLPPVVLPNPPKRETKPEPKPEIVVETSEGERLSCYLAFLPIDPKSMMTSGFEAYFINESNYYLFYNYMSSNNNSWKSRCNGLIEPNTKMFLEEFEKSDLNELEHICVQMIAFKKNKPYLIKNSQSIELRIDTVKFYKLHCFGENDYFDEGALVFPLIEHDVPEKQLLISATEIQEEMLRKKRVERRESKVMSKSSKPKKEILEIDLHINQLLDNTEGLTPADMLNYQLDKFREVIKNNAGNKGLQIVFIHGKGEGVLRAAIEKELKTRYKYPFQDASFAEYGFGATLVKIQ